MRIAVVGGTGFAGVHVARALLSAGHDVRLVACGAGHEPPPWAPFAGADVTNGEGLTDAVAGCDAVVNLAGVDREGRGRQTVDQVNREGAGRVAHAAREAGVSHLVHVSILGADPDPRSPYLKSKWEGEHAVAASGAPATILRPCTLVGPGDHFVGALARLIRLNPVVPVAGDGLAVVQPLAVSDLVKIVEICLERGPSHRTHEVGGPDQLTSDDVIDVLLDLLRVRRRTVHVPVAAMLPGAAVLDRVLAHPPVTPAQLQMLGRPRATRIDSVQSEFGFAPMAFADAAAYVLA